MKQRKRKQSPKGRNIEYMRDMQELRRSNAAQPHVAKNVYNRNDKSWKRDV